MATITLSDLHALQRVIYDPTSSQHARQLAESKLDELQQIENSWRIHIELIQAAQDDFNIAFLLYIGLNKVIWKVWHCLPPEDQNSIKITLIQVLIAKFFQMPPFLKSKIEQIISTICKNMLSYEIIFQIIQHCEANSLNSIIGLSVFYTTFDDVLGFDSRVSNINKDILLQSAHSIAPQLISMCNSICSHHFHNAANKIVAVSTSDNDTLIVAVNLIKVIIAKLPVTGNLIQPETLHILFSIAELSARSNVYTASSLSALEALTEYMCKKFIPGENKEASNAVLVELVAKAVSLVKLYGFVSTQ